MNQKEIQAVADMRESGMEYTAIAAATGLSLDSVKRRYYAWRRQRGLKTIKKTPDLQIHTLREPKILLFDIETAPTRGWVWRAYEDNLLRTDQDWYMLSFAYKWLNEKSIHFKGLPDYPLFKEKKEDDRALVSDLWRLFEEADIIIGHNCVDENTPVLTQDLRWVSAGSLKVGDKIVAFQEGRAPGTKYRDEKGEWNRLNNSVRRIRAATVTANKIEEKECVEVRLSNGDRMITTPDHYWLARTTKDNMYKWIASQDLQPGFRVTKFFNTWVEDRSYDAGWLSGFIAGEGTLKQSGLGFSVDFCQRPGRTLSQAIEVSKRLGIQLASLQQKSGGLGKGDTLYTQVRGGKFKNIELLGRLRIERMIERIDWNSFGGLKGKNLEDVYVTEVVPVGKHRVAVMSTSEKTFFAGGYAMHNCDQFDIKKSNARFVYHRLPPPTGYKTIDTLKIARRHFKFNSNRLNDLGHFLQVGEKIPNTGATLWFECMNGDVKAWKMMKDYNIQDVRLLENVYHRLKPYFTNHPNLALYKGHTEHCPTCNGTHIQKRGYGVVGKTRRQRYQCQDCGSNFSGEKV